MGEKNSRVLTCGKFPPESVSAEKKKKNQQSGWTDTFWLGEGIFGISLGKQSRIEWQAVFRLQPVTASAVWPGVRHGVDTPS